VHYLYTQFVHSNAFDAVPKKPVFNRHI